MLVPVQVDPQPAVQPESPLHEPEQWTGHAAVAHVVESSVALPAQSLPPCSGVGLVQVRVILRVPVRPQAVTEHAPGALQALQPPSIGVITQFSPSLW